MANPMVDKLKNAGLQHGEKVVVGLAAVLLVLFAIVALSKETVDISPDQLAQLATSAESNINRVQDESSILEKLKNDGLVLEDFEGTVKKRETQKVDASKLALARDFVLPEPGAGIIREDVQNLLLAPYDLIATAGRGGIAFFARDASGNLVEADPEETKKKSVIGPMGGYAGMMGMPGGGGGTQKKESVREEERKKQEAAIAQRRQQQAVGGRASAAAKKESTKVAAAAPSVDYKEELRGQRWVSIIGLLDHKQMRDRYARALKVDPSNAHPDYRRVELERQVYDPMTGAWSDWAMVDHETNRRILEDTAYQEDESEESKYVPVEARLEPLAGFLPYVFPGYMQGVYHGQLVDPEALEVPETMLAGMGGYGGSMEMMMMMGGGGYGEMMGGYGGRSGMMDDMGMMGSGMGMMGYGGMMGGGPGGPEVEHKSDAETIMIRALDFTIQPQTIYRYRTRIVVRNPNYQRDDVKPGTDTTTEELSGPWSEISEAVQVPADVSVYAMRPVRPAGGISRGDMVNFDVIAWSPNTGATVHRNFTAGPGDIVGQAASALVALEGEEKPQRETVNFNSRQLLFDTMGGYRRVQSLALTGGDFEVPAVAALLRPDGSIAIHTQAQDAADDQLDFMKRSYRLSISDEARTESRGVMGVGYGDMMGSGMGGYGGGY